MSDVAIRAKATKAVPRDYVIPGAQELLPKTVRASMDGTAAVSAWYPCFQVLDPGGNVMSEAVSSSSIAAGASADVTWFPGLARNISGSTVAVVGARIEATSTQNISNTTNTDLNYQTVDFDTGGFANLGSDARKLTVPTTGLYLVMAEVFWAYNNAGRRLAAITHNGFYSALSPAVADDSRTAIWPPVGGDGFGNPHTTNLICGLVHANAGDFFASGCVQNSGSTIVVNGNTTAYLAVILMGT